MRKMARILTITSLFFILQSSLIAMEGLTVKSEEQSKNEQSQDLLQIPFFAGTEPGIVPMITIGLRLGIIPIIGPGTLAYFMNKARNEGRFDKRMLAAVPAMIPSQLLSLYFFYLLISAGIRTGRSIFHHAHGHHYAFLLLTCAFLYGIKKCGLNASRQSYKEKSS